MSKVRILHFDLNKTILANDVAAGLDERQALSSAVSRCVWGLAIPESTPEIGTASGPIVVEDGSGIPLPLECPRAPAIEAGEELEEGETKHGTRFVPILAEDALYGKASARERLGHGLLLAKGPGRPRFLEEVGEGEAIVADDFLWVVLDPLSEAVSRLEGYFERLMGCLCRDEEIALDRSAEEEELLSKLPRVRSGAFSAVGASTVPLSFWMDEFVYPYAIEVGCVDRGYDRHAIRAYNSSRKDARKIGIVGAFEAREEDGAVGVGSGAGRPWSEAVERLLQRVEGNEELNGVVPSYVSLLNWVQEQEDEYAIVLRTFGHDLPAVTTLHNSLVSNPKWKISVPLNTGRVLRFPSLPGHEEEGGSMVLAWPSLVLGDSPELDQCGVVDTTEGPHGMHEAILSRIERGHRALAIRDDYRWWKVHDETGEAGKVLLLADDEFAVFFDDNIGHDSLDIVDVRSADTGHPIPFEKVAGIHALRAEIALAITDDDYFIRCVQEAYERFRK